MHFPISHLSVARFRSLRELAIGPFGQVNLITGKNNAGKSTLLEAIRLLVTDGAPSTLMSILNYREESVVVETESPATPADTSWFCSLFSDFPDLSGCADPFVITNTNGGSSPVKSVEVKVGWYSEQRDPETGTRNLVPANATDLFGDPFGVPVLDIKSPSRQRRIRIDGRRTMLNRGMIDAADTPRVPCVYLDPFSSRSTAHLGKLWDSIALTDSAKQVVEAMRIISPDIDDIAMIGSDGSSRSRTAIAKSRLFRSPVSLRTFGDGLNRLFGIVLSLVNAAGGVLLVDEIENGLHYSIQDEVWKVIFRMAAQLQVQVFATSHSWDCVHSFQHAANEYPQTGVLARLTPKGGSIIPTLFSEEEMRIATRDQIELR